MNNEENIIEENMEQINREVPELETGEGIGEGKQNTEEGTTQEEHGSEKETESVSQGDSVVLIESEHSADILEELRLINGRLETFEETQQETSNGIFEKELDNYTTTEGLLLVIILFIVAFAFMKLTGGIVRCEKE